MKTLHPLMSVLAATMSFSGVVGAAVTKEQSRGNQVEGFVFDLKVCDQKLSKQRIVYVYTKSVAGLRKLRNATFAKQLADQAGEYANRQCPINTDMVVAGRVHKGLGTTTGRSNVSVEIFGMVAGTSIDWRTPRILRARNSDPLTFTWREYDYRPEII